MKRPLVALLIACMPALADEPRKGEKPQGVKKNNLR